MLEAVLEELPSGRVALRLAPNGVYNDMGTPQNVEEFTYFGAAGRYGCFALSCAFCFAV